MRKILLVIGLAVTVSACVAEVGEDVGAQEEELYKLPPENVDGQPCCAVDYRDGAGETVLCGKRDGLWCCKEDDSACAHCSHYECEPPPQGPAQYTPPSGVFRAW